MRWPMLPSWLFARRSARRLPMISKRKRASRLVAWLQFEVLEGRITPTTAVWTGADGLINPNWSDANNWQFGIRPFPGDSVVFPGTSLTFNSNNDFAGVLSLGSISFPDPLPLANQDKPLFNITGNPIDLFSGIFDNSGGRNEIVFADPSFLGTPGITLTNNVVVAATNSGNGLIQHDLQILSSVNLNSFSLSLYGTNPLNFTLFGSPLDSSKGIISGSGQVIKNGPNGVEIDGANTYFGLTTVNAGSLGIANSSSLGASAGFNNGTTVNTGGTLVFFAPTITAEPLTINGDGTANTPYLGALAYDNTQFNPIITGPITLGSDSHFFTLNGTGTSFFPITVNAPINLQGHTLFLDGTIDTNLTGTVSGPGTVMQNSTRVLSGSQSINSTVQVMTGTLRAGVNGPGVLTTGAVTFQSGTSFHVDLNGTTAGSFSQLVANGNVSLNNATLDIASTGLTKTDGSRTLFPPGTQFVILSICGGLTGNFNGLPDGGARMVNGQSFTISYSRGASSKAGCMQSSVILRLAGGQSVFATGADAGGGPDVRVFNGAGGLESEFFAYNQAFTGGVRVAVGDVNGDGVPDIITAPGPTGGPDIRVFDGATGTAIMEFFAYDPHFTGGVFVATADVNGDGRADIITAPGAGGGPEVKVFDGATGGLIRDFYPYNPGFTGGVHVAGGDTNNDHFGDIITAPGAGGGPEVVVVSGFNAARLQDFYAYNPNFVGGVFLATGDTNGDHFADIITSPGAGGGPEVKVVSGLNGAVLQDFFAYNSFFGGVRVATMDANSDGLADIVTSPGPGGGPDVRVIRGYDLVPLAEINAYSSGFTGGVFVGGH